MSSFLAAMYDFSIPSEVTSDSGNTYDGSHYFPYIQNKIVESINSEQMEFGLNVKKLPGKPTYKAITKKYRSFGRLCFNLETAVGSRKSA